MLSTRGKIIVNQVYIHLVKGIGKVKVDQIYWLALIGLNNYRQTSDMKHTLVGNKIVDHAQLNTWLQWICQRQLQDETAIIYVLWFGAADMRDFTVLHTCLVPTEFLPLHYYLHKHMTYVNQSREYLC